MLYVCPTPIGNLDDITPRVVDALRAADLVACEDTRRTGRLLAHLGIDRPLLSFFEHNEVRRLDRVLEELEAGRAVALVSDAGMPGLSDPGFTLIRAVVERDLPLTVLPGPSAVDVAVVASGLPTDRYTFLGYLPRGAKKLLEAVKEADAAGGTLVAFESPRRLGATLALLAERWPERRVAVCRELTKLHEEILRGTAGEVAAALAEPVRGEIVLVLEPAQSRPDARQDTLDEALAGLLAGGMGVKAASRLVAELTGLSGRELYARAQRLGSDRGRR